MPRLFSKSFCAFVLIAASSAFTLAQTPALSEPALSPDGREIAFVSGGDIWTVPSTGGDAHLLVSNPATESRPLYSPDGKYLAFVSTRTGNGDIYLLNLQSDELKRIAYDDALEQLDGWSPDSRWIYFSSSSGDISGMNDVYRVSVADGTPMQVSGERYVNEFFPPRRPTSAQSHSPRAGSPAGNGGARGTRTSTRAKSG